MKNSPERVEVESEQELRVWLSRNYTKRESVWLVTWKKTSGRAYVSYDQIVDQCLCFGWVDSQARKLDKDRTMLRISPRNPKSNWSGTNKLRVANLIERGLMMPKGIAMVELAKESGTWSFLDDVERLEMPEDLNEMLEKYPGSKIHFEAFPDSSKRGILEWIKTAKTESTRIKRLQETASKAAQNIKANHPKGRDSGPRPA
jgi:uncharacterized protein YdeI (YjbR/CyaY-like superfamily)